MKRVILQPDDIQEWMKGTWGLCAAEAVKGKQLRLLINHLSEYMVVYNGHILYQGSEIPYVIKAWDTI